MELPVAILATILLVTAMQTEALVPLGCNRTCGNVEVPFPFGVGDDDIKGCFLPGGFQLTCNYSFQPPKLFIGTQIEVVSVRLSSAELVALFPLSYKCCNEAPANSGFGYGSGSGSGSGSGYGSGNGGGRGGGGGGGGGGGFGGGELRNLTSNDSVLWNLTLDAAYRLSTTNVYTAIGCGTWALMDIGGGNYGGCISGCSNLDNVVDGQCSGIGCCQASIPKGIANYVTKFNNTDPTRCSYSFLVEKDMYSFNRSDLFHMDNKTKFPFVLDWAIRNFNSCEQARRDVASYACRSANSDCVNSTNDPGYICNCSQGYDGNPYENGGCKDIDECALGADIYPCYGMCDNTPGSYNCSCPEGQYSEDPKKQKCILIEGAKQSAAIKVILGASSGLFSILLLCSLWVLAVQRRKLQRLRRKYFEKHGGNYLQEVLFHNRSKFRIFSLEELEKATNKFDPERVLGSGGFGTVYRGITQDQQAIAVKKSKVANEKSGRDLANEIYILSNVNHKNIVAMVGCCLEDELPILVYAYIPNDTLFHFVHKNRHHRFPFATRMRIARETVEALKYLHNDISPPIVHGDVKSPNILLDELYSVKVSDFGTSKLVPKDKEKFTSYVQGTYGYLDPESIVNGVVTEKSDVYSFGVVLLELLTRKLPYDFHAPEGKERNLAVNFIACVDDNKVIEILDPEILDGGSLTQEVKVVVQIARQCLNFDGKERPTMKDILSKLDSLSTVEENSWEPSGSEFTTMPFSEEPEFPSSCSVIVDTRGSDLLDLELGR